jgi:hypothetical protein
MNVLHIFDHRKIPEKLPPKRDAVAIPRHADFEVARLAATLTLKTQRFTTTPFQVWKLADHCKDLQVVMNEAPANASPSDVIQNLGNKKERRVCK